MSGGSATGWLGSLLVHGLVFALVFTSWSQFTPEPAMDRTIALEAILMTSPQPALRRPAPAPATKPEPAPVPAAAVPTVLTTRVERAEQMLPALPPPRAVPPEEPLAREKALEKAEAQRREAALKASLAAEEKGNALRGSAAASSWYDALRAHIQRQWRRPASATAGLRCTVLLDQVPGGEVVSARITDCNGDEAVRQSIEAAVFRASPLPQPPDAALFERRLELIFAPED